LLPKTSSNKLPSFKVPEASLVTIEAVGSSQEDKVDFPELTEDK
jgi:hypothetical protein